MPEGVRPLALIMLNYERLKTILDLPTNLEQDRACVMLELYGLTFCVDFGTANAIQKLADLYQEMVWDDSLGDSDGE